MIKKDSVILLSAGLDSSVNLYAALRDTNVKLALTFNYGQRAAAKEIDCAKRLSDSNNVPHQVIDLLWLKDLGHSSLTDEKKSLPLGSKISIDNKQVSEETARAVWVPNRNGVFLNIAASFAESLRAEVIIPGFNREEAVTFPDNSLDFMRAVRKSFIYSTATQVDVQCYTIAMSKIEIAELGKKLMLPFEMIWPCYQSGDLWCGQCESCQRAKRALLGAKLDYQHCFEKF